MLSSQYGVSTPFLSNTIYSLNLIVILDRDNLGSKALFERYSLLCSMFWFVWDIFVLLHKLKVDSFVCDHSFFRPCCSSCLWESFQFGAFNSLWWNMMEGSPLVPVCYAWVHTCTKQRTKKCQFLSQTLWLKMSSTAYFGDKFIAVLWVLDFFVLTLFTFCSLLTHLSAKWWCSNPSTR